MYTATLGRVQTMGTTRDLLSASVALPRITKSPDDNVPMQLDGARYWTTRARKLNSSTSGYVCS